MRKRRPFYQGITNHVYQRTLDGQQLFYCIEDSLVFYTTFAVCARSSNVQILELCLMHNHVHFLIGTDSVKELSRFIDHYTSWFVREYNTYVSRKGKLFKKNFGSAPKWDEKKLRSSIIYVGNNPVEKHFCKRAIEYRWNFLAYRDNCHPFSEEINKRNISRTMSRSLKEVDFMVKLNLPLKYRQLIRISKNLSAKEKEQLIDYIICAYSVLDYEELSSHFKSYEDMIVAMDSTTGNEYDIKEPRDSFSLPMFNEMIGYLEKSMKRHEIRMVTTLPLDKKMEIYHKLQSHTSASVQQICNFLHIKAVQA